MIRESDYWNSSLFAAKPGMARTLRDRAIEMRAIEPDWSLIVTPVVCDREVTATVDRELATLFDLFRRAMDCAAEQGQLMDYLGLPDDERDFVQRFRGRDRGNLLYRWDAIATEDRFKVLELNVGSKVGGLNIMDFNSAFDGNPKYEKGLYTLDLWARYLAVNIADRGDFVAIVEDDDYFEELAYFFQMMSEALARHSGKKVVAVRPTQLTVDGRGVYCAGERVDMVYGFFTRRDVARNPRRYDTLVEAIASETTDQIMGFPVYTYSNKCGMALVRDRAREGFFAPAERALIENYLPDTRVLDAASAEDVAARRDFVLKPINLSCGEGIECGWLMEANDWREHVRNALRSGTRYVAQERVRSTPIRLTTIDRHYQVSAADECYPVFGFYFMGSQPMGCVVRAKAEYDGVINRKKGAALGVYRESWATVGE